ncbi:MAG TPA: NUDIX hydrolase [Sphingomicrobium sp.]|nr:NUDIX hydrolase [Sphingomicrobium sp.]
MTDDALVEAMWRGKYITAYKRGRWEYVSRTGGVTAVVLLAEFEGKIILVEQHRVPVGGRCLELPAGLVGDEDRHATVEDTAVKELEEETGFTADRIEILGEFHSSPGMLAESFTLVRAHQLRKIGEGGGTDQEEIIVHLVARDDIASFIESRRREGVAIDVKLMLFLEF